MIISNNFRLLLTIYLLGIVVVSGCSSSNTNMKAGRITEETFIDWCGHGGVELEVPDTKIEILSFLSIDSIKVDQLPEMINETDSLLSIIIYPEIARRAGVEGIVIIEFTIDSLGRAKNYKLIKSIGAGCDEAAIDGILKQKYSPAMKNDSPISLTMRSAIKFSLIYALKDDFIPRPIYINKNDALKHRSKFSLYPPPDIEEADSTNSTGN